MMVSGFNPAAPLREQQQAEDQKRQTPVEKEQAEQKIDIAIERAEKQKEQKDEETAKDESGKFVMNEYQLKELLFMMSSRGNSASTEQLVEQLRKEKQRIVNNK
jgi:hypothetical protein